MNTHLASLAARRKELQLRAEEQRRELAGHVGEIQARCAGVDRGFQKLRNLFRKPVLLAGAAALVTLLGPSRLLSLAGKAAMMIPIARRLLSRVL